MEAASSEQRHPRQFTKRRQKKVKEFLTLFEKEGPKKYGYYGSEKWINHLLEFIDEKGRWDLISDDIRHWIENEEYLKSWIQSYQCKLYNMPVPTSSSRSQSVVSIIDLTKDNMAKPGTSSSAQTPTVKTAKPPIFSSQATQGSTSNTQNLRRQGGLDINPLTSDATVNVSKSVGTTGTLAGTSGLGNASLSVRVPSLISSTSTFVSSTTATRSSAGMAIKSGSSSSSFQPNNSNPRNNQKRKYDDKSDIKPATSVIPDYSSGSAAAETPPARSTFETVSGSADNPSLPTTKNVSRTITPHRIPRLPFNSAGNSIVNTTTSTMHPDPAISADNMSIILEQTRALVQSVSNAIISEQNNPSGSLTIIQLESLRQSAGFNQFILNVLQDR